MARMNDPATPSGPGLTGLGKVVSFLLIAGLIGLGVFVRTKRGSRPAGGPPLQPTTPGATSDGRPAAGAGAAPSAGGGETNEAAVFAMSAADVVEPMTEVPRLDPPAP